MASTEFLAGSGSSSLFVVHVICSFLRILDRFTQEGAFTSAVGLAALCFVPASPRNLRFLNEEERDAFAETLPMIGVVMPTLMANMLSCSVGTKLQVYSQTRLMFF